MKSALIVWGGWDGHQPGLYAESFRKMLEAESFEVTVSDTLDAFLSPNLRELSLIVPLWTMGKIGEEQLKNVCAAVQNGAGMAGCHGGMCDAFRESTEWQFMTGGQWVAHPGWEIGYSVHISDPVHPITAGLSDFDVHTEQYYMHVDPAVKVLATTRFPTVDGPHAPNGPVDVPVTWTKMYGSGRVFYCSLGHQHKVLEVPQFREMMRRGFNWAARNART